MTYFGDEVVFNNEVVFRYPVYGLVDKGSQVYDVRSYGAVGNGSTDDTAAFQSAITAASAAGGGVVYVPNAVYRLDQLTAKSNVTVIHRNGTVLKRPTTLASGTSSLYEVGSSSTNVTNFRLTSDGWWTIDYTDRPASELRKFVRLVGCSGWEVSNVIFIEPTGAAAAAAGAVGIAMSGNGTYPVTNGTVRNAKMVNGTYGYGLTQLSGGNTNIHFENIETDGGVCLRIECDGTGGNSHLAANPAENITAVNVRAIAPSSGGYGNAAVLIANHGAEVRNVHISGVRADYCRYGIGWSDSPNLSGAQGGDTTNNWIRGVTIDGGRFTNCGSGLFRTSTNGAPASENITLRNLHAYNCVVTNFNTDTTPQAGNGRGFDVVGFRCYDLVAEECQEYAFADTSVTDPVVHFKEAWLYACKAINVQKASGGYATFWNQHDRVYMIGCTVTDANSNVTYSIRCNGAPYATKVIALGCSLTGTTGRMSAVAGSGGTPNISEYSPIEVVAGTLSEKTASTVGAAGAASALPATPLGYVSVLVAGVERKIPYYNV